MLAGIGQALPEVIAAYRTGDGVPYASYGEDFREGQAAINRPAFTHDLGGWLAAVPGLGSPARIADLGCGHGHSTLALARAFPGAEVDGIDEDEPSIATGQAAAAAAGLEDRVRFLARDAGELEPGYDLVTVFEALHDMPDPVGVLAAGRAALAPGGCVLVVDEKVADEFGAPGDEVERMMYGWSVSHCLPVSRVGADSAALGTVLRSATMSGLAADAGFAHTQVLPIEHDVFRFYHLIP